MAIASASRANASTLANGLRAEETNTFAGKLSHYHFHGLSLAISGERFNPEHPGCLILPASGFVGFNFMHGANPRHFLRAHGVNSAANRAAKG